MNPKPQKYEIDLVGLAPIHSPSSEEAVLGGVLSDPERCADAAIEGLSEDDFFNTANAKIFRAVCDMRRDGVWIDPGTVAHYFENRKMLEQIGGHPKLGEMAASCSNSFTIKDHIKAVRDKSILRKLQDACKKTLFNVEERQHEVSDVLDEASSLIQQITDSRPHSVRSYTAGDAVRLSMARMKETIKNGGGLRGPSTGIPALDAQIFGLEAKKFIIVGARTNVGKTNFAQTICRNLSKNNIRSDFFSIESEAEDLMDRDLSVESGVPLSAFQNGLRGYGEPERIESAWEEIEKWNYGIHCMNRPTIHTIRTEARKVIRQHKSKLIVIDYLGLIKAKAENRREEIAEVSRGLQSLSRECPETCFIVLAQLNRNTEEEKDKTPQVHHLKDSGQIEQDADIIILLHRPMRDDGKYAFEGATVRVAKGRNCQMGLIPMKVCPHTGAWSQGEFIDKPERKPSKVRSFDEPR